MLEGIDDLFEMSGENVSLGDIGSRIHDLVLIGELDVDAADSQKKRKKNRGRLVFSSRKKVRAGRSSEREKARTLCNDRSHPRAREGHEQEQSEEEVDRRGCSCRPTWKARFQKTSIGK